MKYKFILGIVFLLISSHMAYSQDYLADIEIEVFDDGSVSIDGTTNYEDFENVVRSQQYTSKQSEYWVLNISTEERFENYLFELTLPRYAQINYMKLTPNFRIEEENNQIKLIGTGENKPFTLIVQYKIDNKKALLSQNALIFGLSALFIILVLVILFFGYRLIKNSDNKKNEVTPEEEFKIDISHLPERQQEIIKILKDKKKVTQKELEKVMGIPKSSVSRNVQALFIKGIVEKQNIGQSNYVFLKKP